METYGPGLIMADVARDIVESEFVVAEITPPNPNVYYELGFAHAVGKPVIMLADREELPKLPFDVSSSRSSFTRTRFQASVCSRKDYEGTSARYSRETCFKRVGRQAHGARDRHFRQGHGATESPGSWGQGRG